MMIMDMYEYYKMIKKLNVDIIYSGPLWSDGIEGIADTLKKRLEFDKLPLSSSQSVFSVFVEQMNNMLMYSMEKEHFNIEGQARDVSKGVFILGVKNKMYFVQSGNIMKKESADLIKGRIDHLNTLDKAALRKFYKEQIKKDNANPESRGAGLGFIEIARRASSPIEYSFMPVSDSLAFFSMYITIGEGGN